MFPIPILRTYSLTSILLAMKLDILFLLRHDFVDGVETGFYCPECAEINGVLHYYPKLRHQLDIRYVDFTRPRPEIISLVGTSNQSCPILILAPDSAHSPDSQLGEDGKLRFVAGANAIGKYLHRAHGSGQPH